MVMHYHPELINRSCANDYPLAFDTPLTMAWCRGNLALYKTLDLLSSYSYKTVPMLAQREPMEEFTFLKRKILLLKRKVNTVDEWVSTLIPPWEWALFEKHVDAYLAPPFNATGQISILAWALINDQSHAIQQINISLLMNRVETSEQYAILFIALVTKHYEVAREVYLHFREINYQGTYNNTLLHAMAITNNLEGARLLLTRSPNLDMTNSLGLPPLLEACQAGWFEMVKLLVNSGAPMDTFYSDTHMSCLHDAAMRGFYAMIEFLLKQGVPVDLTDPNGRTPLHDAASHGHFQAVRLLLKRGADVDRQMSDGATPLLKTMWDGHFEIVETLLRYCANPELPVPNRNTALTRGVYGPKYRSYRHFLAIRMLLEAGAISQMNMSMVSWSVFPRDLIFYNGSDLERMLSRRQRPGELVPLSIAINSSYPELRSLLHQYEHPFTEKYLSLCFKSCYRRRYTKYCYRFLFVALAGTFLLYMAYSYLKTIAKAWVRGALFLMESYAVRQLQKMALDWTSNYWIWAVRLHLLQFLIWEANFLYRRISAEFHKLFTGSVKSLLGQVWKSISIDKIEPTDSSIILAITEDVEIEFEKETLTITKEEALPAVCAMLKGKNINLTLQKRAIDIPSSFLFKVFFIYQYGLLYLLKKPWVTQKQTLDHLNSLLLSKHQEIKIKREEKKRSDEKAEQAMNDAKKQQEKEKEEEEKKKTEDEERRKRTDAEIQKINRKAKEEKERQKVLALQGRGYRHQLAEGHWGNN